jgi:hypothetical protein
MRSKGTSLIHPASEYSNHTVIADSNAPLAIETPIHCSARKINGTSDHRRLMSGVSDIVPHVAWRFLRLCDRVLRHRVRSHTGSGSKGRCRARCRKV